jgi:hypothetical protein
MPLADDAAHQTFLEITDNVDKTEDIHQILSFTNNIPLAVDLVAHLVDIEGSTSVLRR